VERYSRSRRDYFESRSRVIPDDLEAGVAQDRCESVERLRSKPEAGRRIARSSIA
jgi:hypothetical protein